MNQHSRYKSRPRHVIFAIALALMLPLVPMSAAASNASCENQFVDGVAPVITNHALNQHVFDLCYLAFATGYSGLTKTPLWSAEHLTRARIKAAISMHRSGEFHQDPNLSETWASELSDYYHSGYDRGHMAPSGDMPDRASQEQSFTLANMVPQSAENNRHIWAKIEHDTRGLALKYGDVYVVTGPLFTQSVQLLKDRVAVPAAVFKAIYVPSLGVASAYIAFNDDSDRWMRVSVDDLQAKTGVRVFPNLPGGISSTSAHLFRWDAAHAGILK